MGCGLGFVCGLCEFWSCVGLVCVVWDFVVILELPRCFVARLAMTARLVILSVSEKSTEFKAHFEFVDTSLRSV